jgi:hypothetical protein
VGQRGIACPLSKYCGGRLDISRMSYHGAHHQTNAVPKFGSIEKKGFGLLGLWSAAICHESKRKGFHSKYTYVSSSSTIS